MGAGEATVSAVQSGHRPGTQSREGHQSLPTLFPALMTAHPPAGRLILSQNNIAIINYSILNNTTLRKRPSPSRGTSPKVGVLQMLAGKERMYLLGDKPLHLLLTAS